MAIPFDEGAGGGATAAATVSDEDLNREAKKSNTTPSYSVGHLSYPEDLLNVPDYGGNYVMFFINERVESKINQKNDYVLEDVDPAVGRAINGAGSIDLNQMVCLFHLFLRKHLGRRKPSRPE